MVSGARLILESLRDLGVDRIFIVSGTDHVAFIEEKVRDPSLPDLEVVPHEITAVSAAMGYSFSGKIGVAMVHTTPGTANAIGVLMDAFTARIPIILIAGRSPYTEFGSNASRDLRIHWAQDSERQEEMVRDYVKYAFEIKRVEQIPETIARAYQIAFSEPRGPVYIVVPREVTVESGEMRKVKMSPFEPGATAKAIAEAKELINRSERPVIVTWNLGRRRDWFDSLKRFADALNIPVLNYIGGYVNYPSTGDMALDHFDLSTSDLIIVVENDVPWIPKKVKIKGTVIRVDTEPSYSSIPFYGFPCDLCVQSTPSDFFDKLLAEGLKPKDREWIIKAKREQEARKLEEVEKLKDKKPIKPKYLSWEVGKLIDEDTIVVNEYSFNPRYAKLSNYGSYIAGPPAGYLGWGLGASIGVKAAKRDKTVIATIGDGQFIFGVPEAFYYASVKYPVLVVLFDNRGWLSVEDEVREVFPEGEAPKRSQYPGVRFEGYMLGKGIEGYGGYYRLVEEPEDVEPSLREGLNKVKEGKPAIIHFVVDRVR